MSFRFRRSLPDPAEEDRRSIGLPSRSSTKDFFRRPENCPGFGIVPFLRPFFPMWHTRWSRWGS